MRQFFEKFKERSPTEEVIHKLALHWVKVFIGKGERVVEVSDAQEFFPELRGDRLSIAAVKDLKKDVKVLIFHTLSSKSLDRALVNLKNKPVKKLIIIQHNKYSLDFHLMRLARALGLTKENPREKFLNFKKTHELLVRHGFIATKKVGSFFMPKMILIFFPKEAQVFFSQLAKILDKKLSESWLREYFARNHVIVCRKFSLPKKSRIDPFYARTALEFDKKYSQKTWVGKMYLRNVEKLVDLLDIKPGQKLLDVGCGTGNYSIFAAKRKAQVTAIDLSPEMLEIAKEKVKKEDLKTSFFVMDAEEMGFPANSFDRVVTASVPHVVDNLENLIKEISRVLRLDGEVVINIVNPFSLAGLETIIFSKVGLISPIRIITSGHLRQLCSRYGLVQTDSLGMEFHQGLPIPWKWRWKAVNQFDKFEKRLSHSPLKFFAAQQLIKFRKTEVRDSSS